MNRTAIARKYWTYDTGLAIYEIDHREDRVLVGCFNGNKQDRPHWFSVSHMPDPDRDADDVYPCFIRRGSIEFLDSFLLCE